MASQPGQEGLQSLLRVTATADCAVVAMSKTTSETFWRRLFVMRPIVYQL